jgi:hypothetical protein
MEKGEIAAINALVETSAYLQDPAMCKVSLRSLSRYCAAGLVRMFLPYVVEHELLSNVHSDLQKAAGDFRSGQRKLGRFLDPGAARAHDALVWYLRQQEVEDVEKEFLKRWNSFKKEARVLSVDIASDHGKRVMESYFRGSKPFATAKRREDIPDAFIFETVKDLVDKSGTLHFVSFDENLRTSCSEIPGVIVHKGIEEFLRHQKVQEAMQHFGNTNRLQNIGRILQFFELGDQGKSLSPFEHCDCRR